MMNHQLNRAGGREARTFFVLVVDDEQVIPQALEGIKGSATKRGC